MGIAINTNFYIMCLMYIEQVIKIQNGLDAMCMFFNQYRKI